MPLWEGTNIELTKYQVRNNGISIEKVAKYKFMILLRKRKKTHKSDNKFHKIRTCIRAHVWY